MTTSEKRFINAPDLCDYLGISRKTAYDLANSDGFPKIRIGKRIVIPVDALEKWITDNIGNSITI